MLDDIENAAGAAGAARARVLHARDNREPSTRGVPIAILGRCWCGDPYRHDWPGKDGGAPHPRVLPEGLRRYPAAGIPSTTKAGA
jgi:hypothetical protein